MSKKFLSFACFLVTVSLSAQSVEIPGINFNTPSLLAPYTAKAPEIGSMAAVLIDAETGTVLYAKNPHEEIPPASLAKLMTMHLVMNEVASGRASLDEIVPLPPESWARNQPPRSSLMYLSPGQLVTLREIMLGMAIPSGNDAAVAAALRFAPTVRDFAAMMTMEARRMGLLNTRFVEPSGISEDNMTTAAEFAAFCREYIRLHPESLAAYHSVPSFTFPTAANMPQGFQDTPAVVRLNRNTLLKTVPGVDGLKTGYIDESGYNIALTAQRDQTRFVAVILGAPIPGGERVRDEDGTRLLNWAFGNFKTARPVIDRIEPARLWKGKENSVELVPAWPLEFTAPIGRAGSLQISVVINNPLIAPLPADYPAGRLIFSDDQGEVNRVTLVTSREYEQGNIFKRIWHSIVLFFKR